MTENQYSLYNVNKQSPNEGYKPENFITQKGFNYFLNEQEKDRVYLI
jgi:hypothetical protein